MKKTAQYIAMTILFLIVASCAKPDSDTDGGTEVFDTHPEWGPDSSHFFDKSLTTFKK